MEGNNWKETHGPMGQPQGGAVEHSALSTSSGVPPIDPYDWRAGLPLESRQRIINKIMQTLKMHLPFSGQEGLLELKKIAVTFEEKIYSVGTSQSDYLRKISLKMLTMEARSQSTTANSLQTNDSLATANTLQTNDSLATANTLLQTNASNNSDLDLGKKKFRSESAIPVEQSVLSGSDSDAPMDPDDWRPQLPPMDPDDWRAHLPLDSRHRLVSNITENLKKQFPISGQEQEKGLQEIKKIVVGFEEKISKIYSDATSQSDYLREIHLKIMDTKSQCRNSSDLGKKRMRSESAIGFMDGNNWSGAPVPMGQPQGGAVKPSALSSSCGTPPMDPDDWRAQLPLDSRQQFVVKIMETLKKHLPYPGKEQEGLQEIEKIAVGLEEKIYFAATSQSDYLRKISLKMLTMTADSQNPDLGPNVVQDLVGHSIGQRCIPPQQPQNPAHLRYQP